jgi:CheY-like chemotaxis protein
MQPLVLAIEPDLRQAAIVKRIVREKVLAEVNVVDSRDAALEAMRTTVPDVLLLSALLSPRDEDELIAHLRTLEHAEHLQTYTIPQLASSIGPADEKPSKGLLSAFRRRKGASAAPSGCDPDLFADEIRVYLQRASEKKRELREAAAMPAVARTSTAPRTAAPASRADSDAPAGAGSSWSSPFEWRPSGSSPRVSPAEPAVESGPSSRSTTEFTAPPIETFADAPPVVVETAVAAAPVDAVVSAPEPVVASSASAAVLPDPGLVVPELAVAPPEPSAIAPEPAFSAPVLVARRLPPGPVVVRRPTEWWFVDSSSYADARERAPHPDDPLASLAVPSSIAAIMYADGCRIRRVRLTAAA